MKKSKDTQLYRIEIYTMQDDVLMIIELKHKRGINRACSSMMKYTNYMMHDIKYDNHVICMVRCFDADEKIVLEAHN